jgi:hypothetical protein
LASKAKAGLESSSEVVSLSLADRGVSGCSAIANDRIFQAVENEVPVVDPKNIFIPESRYKHFDSNAEYLISSHSVKEGV